MLLKLSSVDDSVSNMALGMKGKDTEGLVGILNKLKEDGANAKDVGRALNLAGFSKDATKAAIKASKLSESANTVVTGFDAMATATTGIKGKFNTMKDGAEKLGKALKTKVTTGAKGAWGALKKVAGINPLLTAGVIAAGAGFGAYKLYQAHKDNRLQDASEDADKWQSKNKSLSEQITQYDSLKSQLDAGTASAQEEYNIRSQILEIQNEITSAYGDQAAGIDLVNGSLDEQKAKLEEIRQEKADEFIRDNSSGIFSNPIKDAKKAMETEKNNHIADSIGEGTKQYTLLQKAISRTNQKLKEQGFTGGSLGLEKNGINGTYSLDYKGNAENSKTVQTALQKELKEIAQDTDSTELFEDIQANIDDNIRSADKTIDKYGDFYKQVREAELINDTTKYGKNKKGNGGKIATEWLSDYEDAVNKYNEAFSSGEQETIDSAKKNYDDFYSKLPKDLKEKYAPEIKEITDGLDTEAINKNDFVQALKGADQYAKGFTKTAQELKKLNLTEDDVYGIFNSTDMKDSVTKGRLVALRGIAEQLGIIDDISSSESIQKFIEALGDAGIITASDHIDTSALSAEQLATKVEAAQTALSNINSVISASNSDSGLLIDNITALEESFGGLDSYNAESLLSNTADGVKLNTTALKGLIEQQHKVDSDDLEARIKGQNEELQKQKDILNDVTQSEDNKQNAKEQIDSITDAIERMKQAQSQLYASYKQQMELTSDYQAVLDAESTPNAGARYDNMKSKVKTAKEAFDKGEIGTDDFKTVARYLSPNGFEDPDNFIENYQKAKRYLTDDSSGVINFLQDLQSKGLATMTTLADGTHEWTTSFDDAAEASKQAGMGYEFFMDMFGKAEDYGAFNTFISSAEEGELKVQDLSKQLAEAKTRMAELQSQGADESSLQGQQKVIDELEAKLGKQQGVLDDYYGSYKQKQAQQLEDAKEQLDLMSDQIKNESNQNVKDFLVANFKQLAKEYGLDYNYDENSGNISVDNDSYKDQMSQYGNTWVNPASAEDMGYKEGTQEAKDYQAAVDSLTAAHEKNDAATEESFKTLSQYNAEELKGIELDNNKYDSDDAGLRKAEDALQMLADTYGLTKDQLLEGLEGLGQLKLDVDTSSMENLKHEATEAQEKLNEITGKTYKFNFDTSNLNTIRQQIEQAKEQLSQFQFTDSTGKKRVDYSQNGAKEATTVYAASIKQEQDAEYSNSNIGKVDTSSVEGTTKECITAAQEFMQAKNEMDVQTQLAQEGATNTLDQASQKCQQAYETFKNEATENGIKIDTSDIQTAEDELLALSGEDLSTKFNVDVSDLNTALTDVQQLQTDGKIDAKIDLDIDTDSMSIDDLDSKIQELTNQKSQFEVDGDVEDVEKVQALIDLLQQIHDKKVQVTAETQGAELVDQLQARISELQGKGVTIDAIVQDNQVSQLVNEIAQLPPEVQIAIGVDESNVGDVEAIKAQIEADPASITVNCDEVNAYKPEDKEAKANYTVEDSDVQAYTPPDKDGTVNYTADGSSIDSWTPPQKSGTVVYHAVVEGSNAGASNAMLGHGPKASGTMTSIAHADGTAYNMLNLKPLSSAHAGGNVALNQNEIALTNEVGTESIVRDGVWSLLPGGPHMENLKKGDIIFSASQTEDLLKYGKTNSHARAYANGTLAVSPAHVGGPSTTGYSGLNDKYLKKNSSSSSNKKSSGSSSSKSSSKSSGKSSGKSKSSSSSKDSEQDVDYIEIKFKRLERVISNFGKIASDTFRSLGDRLNHLTKVAGNKKYDSELELLKSEKNTATKAVSYYLKKANGVKLDATTKKKIREGAIDYRTYSSKNDEKYKNIKKYQTFYEKSLDARDKQLEIEENIAKLFSDRFDMISTDFDNDKAIIEHRTNTANNNIDYLEEKGYLGSKANYSAIASATQYEINKSTAKIEALKAERAYALSNPYSGIVKDSEQDKEFQKAIQEEIENRQELNTQLAEANNNMRQVDWDRFDYIQERISDISSEADFMIDLMAQRKDELYQDRGHTDKVENANVAGKVTDKGMAVMGLHGQNYNTYMAQANQYAEEIKKLNAEIAKDPNNTKLIDRRKELLEAQRDNIKSAEDEKQAMADLIEDGINRQIDALGTLIDEYEDSIDSAKDLYDYQKKVKDQTEEISKIQKQLNAYSGDDSEESKANIQKLKEDLKDAQEDLQDTQYDRYISEQKKLLSDLSDKYKETLNARLDNIDALVADMITKSNENKESINQTLQTEADKVGYTISDEMSKIWSYAGDILGTTDDKGIMGKITGVKTVLDAINAKVQSMQTNSDKQSTQVNEGAKTDTALPAKNENTGSNNSNNSNNSNQPAKKNNGKKQGNGKVEVGDHVTFASGSYTADSSGGGASGSTNRGKKVYVTKIQKGAKKPYHISTGKKFGSGDLGWVTKSQLKGYKTGGLVDYTGLAQLDGTPSKPELVLNSVDTENFLKLRDALRDGFDFTPNMNTPMFTNTAFDGIASQIGRIASVSSKETTIGNVTNQVTIQIDHVENYEDFMNQMTKDDKFEKFIQSMTTDRLAGGSKLAKNKYKW